MQKIAISILHYNSTKDTINCLNSIMELDLKDIELSTYVLDNGSKDKLHIDVEKYKKIGLEVIDSKINTGFTGGHNIIYKLVKKRVFDYLLILNNDCLLAKNSLTKLLEGFEERVGAVVPKIYFTKGREYHKDRYKKNELGKVIWYAGGDIDWKNVVSNHIGLDEFDHGQFDTKREITFATGACILLNSKVLNEQNVFDESYFLYYEDADLSVRISNKGYKIIYVPSAIVWHNNAASSGSGSELHDYYLTRNKLIFGMKHAPLRAKIALLRESLRLLKSGRKWQQKGVKDYFLRTLGKGSYGQN